MIAKEDIVRIIRENSYRETDDILIDELLANIEIAQLAKDNINENGIVPEGRLIQNPAINIYNSAVKNISSLCSKLGLTAQERNKIKQIQKEQDLLDEMLDE